MNEDKKKYPLNLPDTTFPMRGDLAKREPLMLAQWQTQQRYQRIRAAAKGRPQFILHDGVRISSTAIRAALADGKLNVARNYLGRPYSISGRVVHGDGMGRKLGFPTANIQMKHNLPPLKGIYVVEVHSDGIGVLQGVASLGVRPTVHHDAR
ncbi:MAG: riboflavin kinase, partial [Sideroxyarcus sp.]|nr:riboflavin kinase [Sideroxyarcus sp.]